MVPHLPPSVLLALAAIDWLDTTARRLMLAELATCGLWFGVLYVVWSL